jgi:hypothetical protein
MELVVSVLICKVENEVSFMNMAFLIQKIACFMCQIHQRYDQEVSKTYIIPTEF